MRERKSVDLTGAHLCYQLQYFGRGVGSRRHEIGTSDTRQRDIADLGCGVQCSEHSTCEAMARPAGGCMRLLLGDLLENNSG